MQDIKVKLILNTQMIPIIILNIKSPDLIVNTKIKEKKNNIQHLCKFCPYYITKSLKSLTNIGHNSFSK